MKKGVICKTSCRFSRGNFEIRFWKGKLYPIILKDNHWRLTNPNQKKGILLDKRIIHFDDIRRFFKPYQPFKKKSGYERWKLG